MTKAIQYVSEHWVCSREKEAYNNKRNIIYFGGMAFEVRGPIFLQLIIFKAPLFIFALCLDEGITAYFDPCP